MRSRLIQVAVTGAISVLSGCAFTQWTDHAFLGTADDPPTHANRQWAGAVILPFAMVGDIVTAPAQLIALLIMGDGGIYARPNGHAVIAMVPSGAMPEQGTAVAALDPSLRDALVSRASSETAKGAGLRAWGVGSDHQVVELSLTPAQEAALISRLALANRATTSLCGG